MRMIDPLLQELEMEGATTRRVLERVPEDKLGWKPHAKSMSLGELAGHVAGTAGQIAQAARLTSFELPKTQAIVPTTRAELLDGFDRSLASAKDSVAGISDEDALQTWTLTKDGQPIFSVPKIGLLRSIMLNHTYHHRGQLSVYLRLLDVPVPSIYGPSADENPFG